MFPGEPDRRVRAVSPFWLAVGFAFALPLERILQRSIGFLLQEVSAQGACGMLSVFFNDVRCAGVRITVDGADVLVDLPCSGARSLIAFAFAFALLPVLFTRERATLTGLRLRDCNTNEVRLSWPRSGLVIA